jgi:thiol-disulfide isomerase/thioredoxin
MTKKLFFTIAMLLMAIGMRASDPDSLYAADMLPVGAEAPDFTIDSVNGIKLSDLRGRYVVLHFWASWCPDCRRDMPRMNELSYVYQSDSVAFIHISYDTDAEAWQRYITDNKMYGLEVSELKKMRDTESYKAYRIHWIPAIYVLNTEGKVLLRTVEVEKLAQRLKLLDYSRVRIPRSRASRNPQFKGGDVALKAYLSRNIRYPRNASNYGLEGQTVVSFVVEADGSITNVKIKSNHITVANKLPYKKLHGDEQKRVSEEVLGQFADEAVRVISSMPAWQPGKRYGVPVRVEYELPINFKMTYIYED